MGYCSGEVSSCYISNLTAPLDEYTFKFLAKKVLRKERKRKMLSLKGRNAGIRRGDQSSQN